MGSRTKLLQIDVKERSEHPLEAVIEPEIGRTFGIMVSEDDFSPAGMIEYKPASINGEETDLKEIAQGLVITQKLISQAATERNRAKKKQS